MSRTESPLKPVLRWFERTPIGGLLLVTAIVTAIFGYSIYQHSHPAPEKPPVITNDEMYNQANEYAASLTKDPLVKYGVGAPLQDDDLKDLRTAYNLYQGMIGYRPQQPATYLICGSIQQALGDDRKAVQHFNQYLVLLGKPGQDDAERLPVADAHHQLSQSYMRLHQYQQAADEASKSIEFFPDAPAYRFDRASALVQMNKIDEAKKDLLYALDIDPNDSDCKGLLRLISKQ